MIEKRLNLNEKSLVIEIASNDGYLLYETFSEENKKFGKPNNPEYLLKQGELLNFSKKKKMKIIEYEEIIITQKHSKAIQRIFAKKIKF